MGKVIAIFGTMDTKGEDYFFLKEKIEEAGLKTLLIDTGLASVAAYPCDVPSEEVIAAGGLYTRTMAGFYLLGYLGEMIQSFFRGLGRLRLTMAASLCQVVLRVILSWLLIPRLGIPGICYSVAVGWFLLVIIEGGYSVIVSRRMGEGPETAA